MARVSIKEELAIDFGLDNCHSKEDFKALIERYVNYYNDQRPCHALNYDTPANYRKRFYKGKIERKDTFESRVLTEKPKFVQKLEKSKASESVSNSEKENE